MKVGSESVHVHDSIQHKTHLRWKNNEKKEEDDINILEMAEKMFAFHLFDQICPSFYLLDQEYS